MATALEQSRERYARLRAPDWVPAPLVTPMSVRTHMMIEHAGAALTAYYFGGTAVRVVLSNDTAYVGWIESLYTVRDPDPDGEGTTGRRFSCRPPGTAWRSTSPTCAPFPFAASWPIASDR